MFISESGAEYTYIREAFGSLAAFLFVWVSVDSCHCNIEVIVLQFGSLGLVLVPWELSSQSLASSALG